MTFIQFERFFTAIDVYHKKEEALGKALEQFSSSWTIIEFCPEIVSSIFSFLKEEMNDEDDWIGWWFYEKKHNPELKAYYKNKKEIKLDTLRDLYGFLLKNRKREMK